MKWALVLALVLCGTTLSYGNEGHPESESEESVDNILRDEYMFPYGRADDKEEDPNPTLDPETVCKCETDTDCIIVDDCLCPVGYYKNEDKCLACGCGPNSDGCDFDGVKKVCKCLASFAQNGEVCDPCDCGTESTGCKFTDGNQICSCNPSYAQKENTCTACECGPNSDGCDFDGEKKKCKCLATFAQNGEVCDTCDCGTESTGCKFTDGNQICSCNPSYAQKEKTCTACECGPNSDGCDFDEEKKICKCLATFLQNGEVCDKCDCSTESIGCKFTDGNQICSCNSNYAQQENTCTACECGLNSDGCVFDGENKTCNCQTSFAQNGDACDTCDCGTESTGCKFVEGKQICTCTPNNAQNENNTCTVCDCGEFGTCSFNAEGIKQCNCNDKYADKGGKCETCECGDKDKVNSCKFNGDVKVCSCKTKFADKEGTCTVCDCGEFGTCSFDTEGNKQCVCNDKYAEKGGKCETCDCGYKDKVNSCKFNGDVKVCSCKTKFADKEGTCTECDCGKDSKSCAFKDNKMVCTCNPDYSQNGGTCEECKCGDKEKVKSCDFNGGVKVCSCISKFADKEGTCTECDCGEKSKSCAFKDDVIVCTCEPKFSQKDQTCAACDCGTDGNCSYVGDDKTCKCKDGYKENTKNICQACDCGSNGECGFDENSKKKCTCNDGHAVKDGKCVVCDCGEFGTCSFNAEGNKQCNCNEKYAEKGGKCETCDCGDKDKVNSCKFTGDVKVCSCKTKFADKEGTCTECDCGDNSDSCKFKDNKIVCSCKTKYSQKGSSCEECVCGPKGKKCYFNDDEDKVCLCQDKFADKKGTCEACDCGTYGNCSYVGDDKTCKCKDGYKENTKNICQACDCGSNGECVFDENSKKKCNCNDGHAVKDGKCIATCDKDNNQCEHDTPCEGTEDKGFFCNCGAKFLGDKCEKVKECETGKYKDCKNTGGTCAYFKDKGTVNCTCSGNLKLIKTSDKCQKKCSKDDCKNGGECKDELCVCLKGTSGDFCSTVDGCTDTLTKTCEKAFARCIFDATAPNFAICKCNEEDFEYKNGNCTPKWCTNNPCNPPSMCAWANGAAFCKCKEVDEYYDYTSNACVDVKKCPLVPCKTNENCKDGKCSCDGNYEQDKDKNCNRKIICGKSKPCYKGADCEEGENVGTVKCACPTNFFYNAKSKECQDGKCFLPKERKKCEDACPDAKLQRKDGDCVAIKEEDGCTTKLCGKFGYCVKKGKSEECVCIKELAKLNKDGKCVLNAETVCASNAVLSDNPNKCNCSGMYKYSNNGITCEKLTCGDNEAQEDCKSKGGICEDEKDLTKGYKCKITATCSEQVVQECSKNQQACYLDELGVTTCKCPPGFSEAKIMEGSIEKSTCVIGAENAYLLQKLPVISSGFLKRYNSVDEIKLNTYIIQSMQMIYKNLKYVFLNRYVVSEHKKVIFCDVLLQFNEDAKLYISRWRSEVKSQADGTVVLPPALLLNPSKFDEVKQDQLEFCSDVVVNTVCGQGTSCKDKKCSCKSGFRVIGPTVQTVGENTILRCEDIDECLENKHKCQSNSKCANTIGSYTCKCDPGYHKKDPVQGDVDQGECVELCTPNPCKNGDCKVNEDKTECSCNAGFKGSFCSEDDDKLKQAQHSTKVVGAVLGTLLAVTFVVIIVYIVRLKKNSYSEDFAPAPRDNAEMAERSRPLRGVSNRGYQ